MPASLDCPEIECWDALFGDRVAPEQRQRFERHLESCLACQERLDQAEECGDPLVHLGRQVGDPTMLPTDPTLAGFLERLHEARNPEQTTPCEPADLYFLRPTDRADLLGTLGNYQVTEVIGQGGRGSSSKRSSPR